MHRHDRVACGEEAFDDDPVGSFDRHRQIGRCCEQRQIAEQAVEAGFVVADREAGPDRAGVVDDGDIVVLAGSVPTDVHAVSSLLRGAVGGEAVPGSHLFGLR
jgi:hypothetical protein